ncbi:MAG: TOBE domain-containing protein, partial [Fusobacteriaceae bacterium]
GRVTEIIDGEYAKINSPELGEIVIEQDKKVKLGDNVMVSIRPEKIKVTKTSPETNWRFNTVKVWVDELIYSGFQSKYFTWVNGDKNILFKAFKQHAVYFDDSDSEVIKWNEEAYISWDADDGFLVQVISDEEKN